MTINQIIYNLRNLIKDAKSDDIKISDRQFEFVINYIRARLIAQDINKGKTISENIKQDLGVVTLIKVDPAETSGINTKQIILRSNLKIPKPLEFNFKDAIIYVGGVDKSTPFQFSTKAISGWQEFSKYSSKHRYAYLKDGYMYVVGPDTNLTKINIQGVFENPREATLFTDGVGNPVYDPDIDNYPISALMIQTLNELFIAKELNYFFQLPQDNTNDGNPDEGKPQLRGQTQNRYGYSGN